VINLISALRLTIGVSALLTDELLTKVGLKLGCSELNPSFNYLKKGEECSYSVDFPR
jgi:hypothetical protein